MTAAKRAINPAELAPPVGFAHAWLVTAGDVRTLYLAGQCGHDPQGRIVAKGDLLAQIRQALDNIATVLAAAEMTFADVVQLNLYVTSRNDYAALRAELGKAWKERCGKHYPAMALFEVGALFDPDARVEIQGIAVR